MELQFQKQLLEFQGQLCVCGKLCVHEEVGNKDLEEGKFVCGLLFLDRLL